jgi:hypothetical protein
VGSSHALLSMDPSSNKAKCRQPPPIIPTITIRLGFISSP